MKYQGRMLVAGLATMACAPVAAESTLGAGVWANYRYVVDDPRDEDTLGDFADEALILYARWPVGRQRPALELLR